jgi:3',5'-cyclic AMP phosphodiesterase CpdA
MRGKNTIVILSLVLTLLVSNITVISITINDFDILQTENSDFYFVHMTDTHLQNESFGNIHNGYSKDRLLNVLNEINSFNNKPVFVVITGDLVEWGTGESGTLNYETLVSCFFKNDNQFYIDSGLNIPVYFTPGNHDYYHYWNLNNYHKYINHDRRYTIVYEDLTLFFIDSGPHYIKKPEYWLDVFARGLEDEDLKWLEDGFNSCTSSHKIVLMHHPAINDRETNGEMKDVLLYNRIDFIELCEQYNVDVVLTGHTHKSRVFDSYENLYSSYPINTEQYSTLFVHTKANKVDDENKPDCNYRNISIIDNVIWIEEDVSVGITAKYYTKMLTFFNILRLKLISNILKSISFCK